ncbi:hypothetical protein ABID21_000638 [Pseudorhizobium tarimense]|uniref:Uncharacterized protein n=1 Tax=Pseudorhizobium tarimense TaxID=1079109 RepID=A0ABV2H1Y1_9HYPH|nr:hypothetical protein [Pseudorhizobium tarimense]MCJ8517846.1 hypothetical protein [Pseudorhizobium tarimense]
MPARFIHIRFTSPSASVERKMTVEDAIALMAKHVPAKDLDEALSFLEMDRMGEGYYKGRNWSITFRVANG